MPRASLAAAGNSALATRSRRPTYFKGSLEGGSCVGWGGGFRVTISGLGLGLIGLGILAGGLEFRVWCNRIYTGFLGSRRSGYYRGF